MKKILFFCKIIILALVLWCFYTLVNYNITEANIKSEIKNLISEKKDKWRLLNNISLDEISIERSITKGNKRLVIFSISNSNSSKNYIVNIGHVTFKKGINNKYKVEQMGFSTNLHDNVIFTANNSKFIVLFGHNYKKKISKVIATVKNRDYKLNIGKEDIFVKLFPFDNLKEDTNSVFAEWKLYDKSDNDITNAISKDFSKRFMP